MHEMEHLMRETVNWEGPIYIRLAKGGDKIISNNIKSFKIGKAITYSSKVSVLLVETGILLNLHLKLKNLKKN